MPGDTRPPHVSQIPLTVWPSSHVRLDKEKFSNSCVATAMSAAVLIWQFPTSGSPTPCGSSFDPRHCVWSLEERSPAPIGLRGRWAVPRPDVPALSSDPAAGSFVTLPALATTRTLRAPEGLDGRPTGLAFDSATDRFLLTTEHGLSLAAANFRYFLVPGPFDEVRRGRFATVRARMMFVRSVAFDRASNAIFTISLKPGRSNRRALRGRRRRHYRGRHAAANPLTGGRAALKPCATRERSSRRCGAGL